VGAARVNAYREGRLGAAARAVGRWPLAWPGSAQLHPGKKTDRFRDAFSPRNGERVHASFRSTALIEAMADNTTQDKVRRDQWIVCQTGAREHYVLAAELHRRGQLAALCTDIWAREGSLWKMAASLSGARGRKLCDRYEPALRGARVFSESPFNLGA